MTYNFHLSCKNMHLSFISVCNEEHKGVTCNMASSSNSSQSTRPVLQDECFGKNYLSFLGFTRNYEWIFCPLSLSRVQENIMFKKLSNLALYVLYLFLSLSLFSLLLGLCCGDPPTFNNRGEVGIGVFHIYRSLAVITR